MQPFRPEVATRLAELAPRLLAQLDAMTDRMVDVLVRTEPAYRELVEGSEQDLRHSTRSNLEAGLRSLVAAAASGGTPPVASARAVGARRAAQGLPLEAVLRAYRLGGQVTWETLLAVSRDGSAHHDTLLLEVAGSIWRTNDAECAALAEGYRLEQRRLEGVDEQARQQALDGLLDGRGGDPAFVRGAAEVLGLPLDGRLMAVVGLPGSDGAPALRSPGESLLKRGVRSVWGVRGDAQVGLVGLGATRPGDLLALLRGSAHGPVGVSDVVDGAPAVGTAYRLAETAVRTLPAGESRVASIDDRLPEALLSNSPEISSRLVGQSLGGLLELPEEERSVLLDTLAAFLATDGSPTRAADALYCHRNTVMHRLRRIESVTGRKVTDPRSRLLWQLALLGTEHGQPTRRSA
ncbi:PucR family transcriptional regulator [Blastococcus sp. MG754426]|uniref:PucR family transcriptional regulator n=1 Tax=unclassified Blastococcus TaxID=2619396 RepID=UPI001EF0F312|nr:MULTISPECIES: helix-turn-helix domain-containing protein [unclassified Blastococcus]MCF6508495.1 PucR family transcriptional regulator [Blastococcus sp. MG754426]MCF6513138.1 PucR family transcriptional regulator [Blastococcus sp. MG754427]MCF6735110.1 PucR family transcriptional regulator [Blastococcus sp. KM273129]